ncbi:unnamed protein product, partial [Symbiodinium necroappetens]
AAGFRMWMENSCQTGQGGSSGGVAVLAKRHLNFRFLDSFQLQGKGFVLAVARFAGSDIVFGSLYLETGQDISTPTNAAILAKLAATLQALAVPWLVAGDFNCDLDTIRQTRIAETTSGAFIGAGEATCSTGGQIDYVWVHRRLQGLTAVSVAWAVPWRPHAALRVQLQWGVGQLPMLQVLKKPAVRAKREASFSWSPAPFVRVMSHVQINRPTRWLADFSHSVECSLLEHGDGGRGWNLAWVRKPLAPQQPEGTQWKGNLAGFWNRLGVWLASYPGTVPPGVQAKIKEHLVKVADNWHDDSLGMTAGEFADRMCLSFPDASRPQVLVDVVKTQLRSAVQKDTQERNQRYQVPWRPHAALHVQLQWGVGQLPMLQVLKKPAVRAKREASFSWSPAPFVRVMSHVQINRPTRWLADFSHSVECSLLEHGDGGRGWNLAWVRKPLAPQQPEGTQWKGNLAGFWNRLGVWLVSYPGTVPPGVQAKIKEHLVKVADNWHDDSSGMTAGEFADRMCQSFPDASRPQVLVDVVKTQLRSAVQKDTQERNQRYQAWLSQATSGHMRALWRALKTHEAKTQRPYQDLGSEVRIHARRAGWWEIWCAADTGRDAGQLRTLSTQVRMAAQAQSQQLRPINLQRAHHKFRTIARKACGPDEWTADMLRALDQEVCKHTRKHGVTALVDLSSFYELVPHAVLLREGSLQPVGLYGHQATGVTPRRLKWIRLLYAEALGRMKIGSVIYVLEANAGRTRDPKEVIMAQHIQAHSRMMLQWPREAEDSLTKAWQSLQQSLSETRWPWQKVTGPLAAMVTYLKELGWEAQGPRHWSISVRTYDVASAEGLHAVVWHLKNAIQQQRWTAVAATPGAEDAVNGIDWQAANKAVKHLAPLEKTAVHTLWQAALKAGPGAFCQRCQTEASLQHVLYDCAMWVGQALPPPSILSMQAQGCHTSLWLRGLPAKRAFYEVDSSAEIKGVWPVPDVTDVRFATDATGPKDPRDGPVIWGVIAFRVLDGDQEGDLNTGRIQVVGSITGAVSHEQTVFRGEAAAVCETVQAHPGEDELDITLDCEGVLRRILRRNPGHSNRDLLDPVRAVAHRLRLTWINSHLGRKAFGAKFGHAEEWRRQANFAVDELVKKRALRIAGPTVQASVRLWDKRVQEVLQFLGQRVSFLLTADEADKAEVLFQPKAD